MSKEPTEEKEVSKQAGGRPLKFGSVKEFDKAIDAYLGSCSPHVITTQVKVKKADGGFYWADDEVISEQLPVTVSGAAFALGTNRRTLLGYKGREEFLPSIQRLLAACEAYAESQLFGPGANGAKFNLINNYRGKYQDWSDRHEVSGPGGVPIPLLAGVAPDGLVVEDGEDDGDTPADHSSQED